MIDLVRNQNDAITKSMLLNWLGNVKIPNDAEIIIDRNFNSMEGFKVTFDEEINAVEIVNHEFD